MRQSLFSTVRVDGWCVVRGLTVSFDASAYGSADHSPHGGGHQGEGWTEVDPVHPSEVEFRELSAEAIDRRGEWSLWWCGVLSWIVGRVVSPVTRECGPVFDDDGNEIAASVEEHVADLLTNQLNDRPACDWSATDEWGV